MKFRFDPEARLLIAPAIIVGPLARVHARLAIDTGATYSMVNVAVLTAAGYDPAAARMRVTTGSGVEYAAQLKVNRFSALSIDRSDFPILAHTLPPSATVNGVLELDFLRGHRVEIDFRKGQLTLD